MTPWGLIYVLSVLVIALGAIISFQRGGVGDIEQQLIELEQANADLRRSLDSQRGQHDKALAQAAAALEQARGERAAAVKAAAEAEASLRELRVEHSASQEAALQSDATLIGVRTALDDAERRVEELEARLSAERVAREAVLGSMREVEARLKASQAPAVLRAAPTPPRPSPQSGSGASRAGNLLQQ